jgi:hypothetical protein
MAEDLDQGFVDRLRSLPIPRSAVLAGRALADTAMQVWGLAITVAIGFAVGFRLHGSVGGALAAFGPVTIMVDAVRVLSQGQAAEALLGHGAGWYMVRALAWSAAILATFGPLAVARYRRG